jgi:transposase
MRFARPLSERRTGYFLVMPRPGERSAIIYSIIESCRRHGIEAYTYLHDVLMRLPSMTNRQIKDVVLKAWAEARRNTAVRAA